MNRGARLAIFIAGAIGLGALLSWGYLGLPAFGRYPGPYGDRINSRVVSERHVTNAPTAVNFDYRGLDTLGEEYILFASVAAIILIIRRPWGELTDFPENDGPGRKPLGISEAARAFAFPLILVTVIFGVYIILHGIPTPGGGFHGGVIVASGSLLVYLAAGTKSFRRVHPHEPIDIAGALGAGGYILVGLAGLLAGQAFLQDILPLGPTGEISSGGTIAVINFAVGVEVATAFILIFSEFVKEITKPRRDRDR